MTAVEWLAEQLENELELYNSEWEKVYNLTEQAKLMEEAQRGYTEEQINNAVENVFYEMLNGEIDLEQFQQSIIQSLQFQQSIILSLKQHKQ